MAVVHVDLVLALPPLVLPLAVVLIQQHLVQALGVMYLQSCHHVLLLNFPLS